MNFYEGLNFTAFSSDPKHHVNWRHAALYYGIQYNHSGRFYLRVDNGPIIKAEGPCAFITHPGVFFEYGYCDETTRHHNHICVLGDRISRYLESGLLRINDQSPLIKVTHPDRFLKTMVEIMALLRKSSPSTPPRAVLLFEDLLLQLFHEPAQSGKAIPPHHYQFFNELISDIRKKPEFNWCFEKTALEHGLSFRYFRRLFKTITGMPPQQFLIHSRLQLAALMLTQSTNTAGDIAEATGFGSNIYFSKLFKQYYKVTPLEYRREFSSPR